MPAFALSPLSLLLAFGNLPGARLAQQVGKLRHGAKSASQSLPHPPLTHGTPAATPAACEMQVGTCPFLLKALVVPQGPQDKPLPHLREVGGSSGPAPTGPPLGPFAGGPGALPAYLPPPTCGGSS